MRLGLGIGVPYGSGVLNPDKLSLDLQFATDKTLTARKGPTPTFTRVSGATQVNASGLIEYAPENLLLRSDDFGNATWQKFLASVTTNTVASPSGVTDADTLIETATTGQHYTFQTTTKEAGSVTYCVSVYYKNASGTRNLALALTNGTSSGKAAVFTTSGSVTATNVNVGSGAGFTFLSANVESVGNGWYRASITVSSDTATRLDAVAYLSNSTSSFSSYAGDGVSSIYLWGAQLERNAVARTYNPTTASQFYAPRFDHDPETFACKGLLIEEQRWNLTPNSQNPAGWTSGNGTVTNQGSIISPSGANDGYLAGIGVADLNSTNTTSQPSAAYTASVFLKRDNTDWVRLQLAHVNNTNTVNAWFDLATGAVGTVSIGVGTLTFLSAQITPFGNNWYRCSVTATFPTAGTLSLRVISTTVNNSVSRVAGSIYGVWGFQLEAGSFPTSYIPTTTAALFRSADVCSITGGDFTGMYNGLEGTIIAEGSVANLAGNNRGMWAINNNTSAHGFLTYYDVTTAGISSQSRNTGSTTLTPNFLNSANTLFKRALAYRTGQASICTNGSSVTATDVTISTQAMLTLQVGNMLAGSFYWSGHIARIRYFKKHLPDAKLQSLTTL